MAAETLYFLQEHTALRAGSLDQIKSVIAQPAQRFFITSLLYLGCHSSWVSNPFNVLPLSPSTPDQMPIRGKKCISAFATGMHRISQPLL